MANHNDNLAFYSLLALGAGIYTFFKGFREFRKYRLVADTPEIPIRSLPMGLVKTHGRAEGDERATSPVSHTPCYVYKVVIEKWKTDSYNRGGWSPHRTDVDGVKFHLADATGRVVVDPRGAELDLPLTDRRVAGGGRSSSTGGATEAELLQYVTKADVRWGTNLVERGLEAVGPLHDPGKEHGRQAWMEALQHAPGSPEFTSRIVALLGPKMAQRLENLGPQSDPQKEQARLAYLQALKHPAGSAEFMEAIRLAGGAGGAARPADHLASILHPGATGLEPFGAASGHYRFTEYCLVPGQSYDVMGTCAENPQPQDEHDRNLLLKGHNEPTFLISSKSEKEVQTGLKKRALRLILGGAALAIISMAVLLAKLGWL